MTQVTLSFSDDMMSLAELPMYQEEFLTTVLAHVLTVMHNKVASGMTLPYFAVDDDTVQAWIDLPKSLDMYVCDLDEGRALNLDARGKDYATNILSYPSGLTHELCHMMGNVSLGELVLCHDVVVHESQEQGKTLEHHLTHLVVHGILHLLGFDHELGQNEQDEMEALEIEILATLGVDNPYE